MLRYSIYRMHHSSKRAQQKSKLASLTQEIRLTSLFPCVTNFQTPLLHRQFCFDNQLHFRTPIPPFSYTYSLLQSMTALYLFATYLLFKVYQFGCHLWLDGTCVSL